MEKRTYHKIIGSDETGKGEIFKYLVVTAAYTGGADDIEKYDQSGVDDSKKIPKKIPKIGKELTGINDWEDLLKHLNEKGLFVTDRSVTKIITNKEYNERWGKEKGKENANDIIKEAHLEVISELYKRYPGSEIVVDNFYGKSHRFIDKFKMELSSRISPEISEHIFVENNADSNCKAVSLASVISAYICNLCYDHVQEMLTPYKKNIERNLTLPKGSPGIDNLSIFFSELKPERKNEFIHEYAKKSFSNVQKALGEGK